MVSLLYFIWTHISRHTFTASLSRPSSPVASQHSSSQASETREGRRNGLSNVLANKTNHGYVWMSVPKNYRCGPSVSIASHELN
jgi:hypothetical protein